MDGIESRFFYSPDTGYTLPTEILEGDFRQMEGSADPDHELAAEMVARNQGGTPDPELISRIHLEYSRLRRAYDDIQSRGEAVRLDAYWQVTAQFQERIYRILGGEDLH